MRQSIPLAVALLVAFHAEPAGKFSLTIDNIMRGPGLVGYEPSEIRWSGDGERIYFHWKQAGDPAETDPDTYVVNRDGSGLRKLSEDEAKLAPPAAGDLSKDRKRIVYAREGDIFVYDNGSGQTQQITKTADMESNPHWLREGKRIYFMRSNNLYVMSLENGSLTEMTDIRMPGAPGVPGQAGAGVGSGQGQGRGGQGQGRGARDTEEQKGTDSQEYLKKEEKELLEVVRERAAKREADDARRKKENPRKPFTLQARPRLPLCDKGVHGFVHHTAKRKVLSNGHLGQGPSLTSRVSTDHERRETTNGKYISPSSNEIVTSPVHL